MRHYYSVASYASIDNNRFVPFNNSILEMTDKSDLQLYDKTDIPCFQGHCLCGFATSRHNLCKRKMDI